MPFIFLSYRLLGTERVNLVLVVDSWCARGAIDARACRGLQIAHRRAAKTEWSQERREVAAMMKKTTTAAERRILHP